MNSIDTGVVRTLSGRRPVRLTRHWMVWTAHLASLVVLIALLCWFNARAIENAVVVWWVSPTFSHCFAVIPISAYLIFRRRHELAGAAPSAYPIALLLAAPLVLLTIAGRLADINEFEQFAFVGIVQVLIVAFLGPAIYRRILFPCLFLFFLVPTGDYLIDPLQRFTTHFVSVGLTVLGIPHFVEGNIIKLSNGIFEVAEACAGLRFLIATLAIGVLFAWLSYRKWQKAVLFLLACFALPVVANGFRALGIVLIAHWSDNKLAVGVDHLVYGWGFLVAVLLVLMVIGGRYADPALKQEPLRSLSAARLRSMPLIVTFGLSAIGVGFAPAFLYWDIEGPSQFNASVFTKPLILPGWQQSPASGAWSPDYRPADGSLAFTMHEVKSPAPEVDVFLDYYAGKNGSRTLLSPNNKIAKEAVWHEVSDGDAKASIGEQGLAVREAVISSGGLMRIVWWTYWTAGRFTPSVRVIKIERFRNLFSGSGDAALLAVSTPADEGLAEARARLDRAFRALAGLPARLQRVSGG